MNTVDPEPFYSVLQASLSGCGIKVSEKEINVFSEYYALVKAWNRAVHLTSIIEPVDFARRHIAESMFAVRFIDRGTLRIWDIGSGLGIPGIPLAISRPDLKVILVEANRKKAFFLKEAADLLGLDNVSVINDRSDNISVLADGDCVTARAVEKMGRLVKEILVDYQNARQFLFFVTPTLRICLLNAYSQNFILNSFLLPFSKDRWLVSAFRFT